MDVAADRRHASPVRRALRLDGLAVAALVAYVAVTGGDGRNDDVGFFGDPLPDGLAVLALGAVLTAGVVAARALLGARPRTLAGRGLLLIPLLLAAGALLLVLGDLVVPQ